MGLRRLPDGVGFPLALGRRPRTFLAVLGPGRAIFEGNSKAAARRARDSSDINVDRFDNHPRLAIVLRFRGRSVWQIRKDGRWHDFKVVRDADE